MPVALHRGDIEEELDLLLLTRFIDAAEQLLLAGRRFPVDTALAVAALPLANAHGAQRVFKETLRGAHHAKGAFAWQAQLSHGVEARVDNQPLLCPPLHLGVEKAKAVASGHSGGAKVMKAACCAGQGKGATNTLIRARHPEAMEFGQVGRRIDLYLFVR